MNETFDFIIYIVQMAGVAAFAIYGATVGFKASLDPFGVCVLGVINALGGGICRDLVLGIFPPIAFTRYDYAITSIVFSLLTFVYSYFRKNFSKSQEVRDKILDVIDAFGLGFFVIAGVETAVWKYGHDNGYLAVSCAVLTVVGGGILRDVLVRRVPTVLYKHFYAIPALLGGILYFELSKRTFVNSYVSIVVTVVFVVVIRVMAMFLKINLPQAKGEKIE
jgi:uncharacterized membrane protein YeiH